MVPWSNHRRDLHGAIPRGLPTDLAFHVALVEDRWSRIALSLPREIYLANAWRVAAVVTPVSAGCWVPVSDPEDFLKPDPLSQAALAHGAKNTQAVLELVECCRLRSHLQSKGAQPAEDFGDFIPQLVATIDERELILLLRFLGIDVDDRTPDFAGFLKDMESDTLKSGNCSVRGIEGVKHLFHPVETPRDVAVGRPGKLPEFQVAGSILLFRPFFDFRVVS